jgi:cell fate (sporulation/competence/biofilm development) regulator YlbF (YheA/YmcA/DUF963 family)
LIIEPPTKNTQDKGDKEIMSKNTIYFEKARELGNLILESDEAKILNTARQAFDTDNDAKKGLEAYSAFQMEMKSKVSLGETSQEEFAEDSKKLMEMAEQLKNSNIIRELMTAEDNFNNFVTSVMNILKFTITGTDESDERGCHGCSGGSCGSCE